MIASFLERLGQHWRGFSSQDSLQAFTASLPTQMDALCQTIEVLLECGGCMDALAAIIPLNNVDDILALQ